MNKAKVIEKTSFLGKMILTLDGKYYVNTNGKVVSDSGDEYEYSLQRIRTSNQDLSTAILVDVGFQGTEITFKE